MLIIMILKITKNQGFTFFPKKLEKLNKLVNIK